MEQDDIDFEMLPEVLDEVREHLPSLEQDLHRLVRTPDDADLLASAFRHMHTIKGDFSYCRATHVVDFVHQLEGVMQSLRARTFDCSAQVAEALLQSIDQLADMMQDLAECRPFDEVSYHSLAYLIDKLASAGSQEDADNSARDILMAVHGLLPEMATAVPPPHLPVELRPCAGVGKTTGCRARRTLPVMAEARNIPVEIGASAESAIPLSLRCRIVRTRSLLA